MTRRSSAFTLIEVLVALAIIALLIGLLLPAVQKVRAAAARIKCQNNLKQIALAMTAYHEINGHYSYGWVGNRCSASSPNQSIWIPILPYIEQEALYSRIDVNRPTYPDNQDALSKSIATFLCPSDAEPVRTDRHLCTNNPYPYPAGAMSYRGSAGSNWPFAPYRHWETTGKFANNTDSSCCGNGVFTGGYFDHPEPTQRKVVKTRMAEIEDGMSNTLLLGEAIGEWSLYGWWYWHNVDMSNTATPLNLCVHNPQECTTNWHVIQGFSSRHPEGANFARADGGVVFVRDSLDVRIYRAISTIDAGEVVSGEW